MLQMLISLMKRALNSDLKMIQNNDLTWTRNVYFFTNSKTVRSYINCKSSKTSIKPICVNMNTFWYLLQKWVLKNV